jgi:hypothetical protein
MPRRFFCLRRWVVVISFNTCTPTAKARIRGVRRRALKRPLRPCRISEFFSLRTPLIQGTKKVLSDARKLALGIIEGCSVAGPGKVNF